MVDDELSEEEERLLGLLEVSHSFPGPFLFKLIFRSEDGVEEQLVARICEAAGVEVPDERPPTRASAAGRFVSMSLELTLPSAREVLRLYRVIGSQDEVISYF